MLIFLNLTPRAGVYFIVKGLTSVRLRIYWDRVSKPVLLGKGYIPQKNIETVAEIFGKDEPLKA